MRSRVAAGRMELESMQIEKLVSMPTQLPPPTTTTIFDDARRSPRIWSFKSLVMAKWRSKGALILYATLTLTLLGCKMFWSGGPHKAAASGSSATAMTDRNAGSETRQLMAKLEAANKAKAAAAAKPTAAKPMAAKPAEVKPASTAAPTAPRVATAAPAVPTAKKPVAAAAVTPTTAPVASAKAKAPAAAAAAADALGALYIDETNGFSIRFPAGWLMRTFEGEPWVIDVGDGRVGLISVGFSPFPDGFTAENIPPEWIAKKIKRKADTTLHAQGYAMIGGRKALWSKSTGPLPMSHASPRMTRVNYILPLGDGRVLELRVAAAPEQFDRLVPVMKKSVETFAIQTPRRREREPMASAAH